MREGICIVNCGQDKQKKFPESSTPPHPSLAGGLPHQDFPANPVPALWGPLVDVVGVRREHDNTDNFLEGCDKIPRPSLVFSFCLLPVQACNSVIACFEGWDVILTRIESL